MNRAAQGFTLLEVMVAVAILGIGLTAISGALGMVVRSMSVSAGYERAQRVANNTLARFLAMHPTEAKHYEGMEEGVRWRLLAKPDDEYTGLLRVIVEAQFQAAGAQRSVVLETREAARTVKKTVKSAG